MSLAKHNAEFEKAPAAVLARTPPLENGDHLTSDEFERRWKAMPALKRAELIEGIVYMPAALRADQHGDPHTLVMTWVGVYQLMTPGVIASDNSTVRLDSRNVLQPDACLRLPPQLGSTTRLIEEGYLEGGPDLVVEVAASSASIDLHAKRQVYARHGVREYVVWRTMEDAIDWFVLEGGEYAPLAADASGWLKSRVFAGLWLQPQALLHGFPPAIHAMMHEGMKSPEHAEFIKRLAAALDDAPKPKP